MCRLQKKLDSHQVQKYSPGAEQIRHVGDIAILVSLFHPEGMH